MRAARLAALALLFGLPWSAAQGQAYSPLALSVDATQLTVTRSAGGGTSFDGQALGASASLAFWRVVLDGSYVEGSLSPLVSTLSDQDYVDARVVARVRVAPGVSLGAGPHLRAYVTPSGTARWTRFELHARGEGELIGALAFLRVDGWFAPSATYEPGGGQRAMGGEASLLLRIPRTPAALLLGYSADRAIFADGADEVVEGVRVALVLDRILRARSPR